jgi:serine O-acetyltransferase
MNAIKFYRIANWCYCKRIPLIPTLFKFLTFLVFNSVIPAQCQIGKNSRLMYGGIGVVIHKRSRIGNNVALGQGITIGRKLKDGAPVIGNDVYIAAGSRVLGDIRIGSNVIIAANAVVVADVPDNSVVAGVPAVVIRQLNQPIYEILGDIL